MGNMCCVGVQERAWKGRLLDDLRVFGINVDKCMTIARDDEGWCKTAEQGAARVIVKLIPAEKARAGQQHADICPNVAGWPRRGYPEVSVLVLVRSPYKISHK